MEPLHIDPAAAGADLLDRDIFQSEQFRAYFRFLRKERPIYFQKGTDSSHTFWNITRHHDISAIERNHHVFSSAHGIVFEDFDGEFPVKMLIAMDPPRHTECRAALIPLFSSSNLAALEDLVRARAIAILDALPRYKLINWVDAVARELTGQMLATLLGISQEDRYQLLHWSDLVVQHGFGRIDSEEQRRAELMKCLVYFSSLLRRERANACADMVTSLLGSAGNLQPSELLGNLLLFIIAGNDTTRNSITGGVLALHESPEQRQLLYSQPELIPNMVSEIIRWQTPLAYMRRTATVDIRVGGQSIRQGDKVILWYASANRDEEVFDDPDRFLIDRKNARDHLAFGSGIHRCVGARFAELQLRILWEEILARFSRVEVVGSPKRVRSSFVAGFTELQVVLHPR
jgi:cytochrome P450